MNLALQMKDNIWNCSYHLIPMSISMLQKYPHIEASIFVIQSDINMGIQMTSPKVTDSTGQWVLT